MHGSIGPVEVAGRGSIEEVGDRFANGGGDVVESLVYNIPARMVDLYHGCDLILRSSSPGEILYSLARTDSTRVQFIQLLTPIGDASVLEGALEGLPIEIVLSDPNQFQSLYHFTNLVDSHPLRISIPVVAGFSKAVKLATALNFSVRLQMEQPTAPLMIEVQEVLDLYLHRSYVRQPIEFFQAMLLSFYQGNPISLWDVAEENPAKIRYVTEDGSETISRRFFGITPEGDLDEFVWHFGKGLLDDHTECHDCDYFTNCQGYFKWPDRNYSCDGIKNMFATLEAATNDVRNDLAQYQEMRMSTRS